MRAIGIDIGGSKIAIGVVECGGVLCRRTLPNSFFGEPDKMAEEIAGVVNTILRADKKIVGIGVGSPGWVIDGVIYDAVNLGIKKYSLQKKLQTSVAGFAGIAAPVFVENDARTALLAELRLGALKGVKNGGMITFGTGIGGGLVINGDIFYGSYGYAGEVGHLTTQSEGECPCGKIGCFELTASVTALLRQATTAGLAVANGRDFFKAAEEKNQVAQEVLTQYIEYAARGVIELAMLMDLEAIAIGGGISSQTKLFINPLREKTKKFAPNCKIIPARFTNDAGIIGAALQVKI